MKCPKCDFEIDEKMLACPNCKKVLKLVCPKCKTINQGNVCKKCGFTIISKCHQCGKINQTISGKCAKCGFSTYTSVAINTSNIDEFACLTIEFPNLDDIKTVLGSTKLYEKFRINLDRLILNFVQENELSREIVDDAYIIKFNKEYSYKDSAKKALDSAIEILNSLTVLNSKLNKVKNILLQCNIAVLKRDINSLPQDYKSGFDIKMIYQGKNQSKLLSGFQVITDSQIYEVVGDDYELATLSSTFVKNQMIMFFELNIKKYVKIPKEEEKVDESVDLPTLPIFEADDEQEQNEIYNVDAVNFDELKFNFANVDSLNLIGSIIEKLQLSPLNLIAVRADENLVPRTQELLTGIANLNKYSNIFKVTCHDGMKYEPYGFFRELISEICNYSKAPRNFPLHKFEVFSQIDAQSYVYNLINMQKRESSSPEDARNALFDVFYSIFSSISNSLIFIEDFDRIDDSSFEILQSFFEKFDELKISYITTAGKKYSLHKEAHFLLSNPNYSEIFVKPTPIKDILTKNAQRFKNLASSYYMQKIAQHFKGSVLYFNIVINYLIQNEAIELDKDGCFSVNETENIFIPSTLDDLISKHVSFLHKDLNAYKLFTMLTLIGPRVDFGVIELFEIPEVATEIQKLIAKGFIYQTANALCINNYNLYKKNLLRTVDKIFIQQTASELLEKAYAGDIPTSVSPLLYSFLESKNEEFLSWQKLAELNNSLGDFSAYLNCSNKFLNVSGTDFETEGDEYKKEVYENISNLMYKYTPEKQQEVLQDILKNFEKYEDDDKIINLFNKMLQGYLLNGDYQQALNAIKKIFAKFPNFSINPNDDNFNVAFFFISLIKIEILFSIGNFKDCVEATNEILEMVTPENLQKLKPNSLTQEKFENTLFDAFCFAAFSKVVLLDSTLEHFIDVIKEKIGKLPQVFSLFVLLQGIIRGEHYSDLPANLNFDEDRFSKILISLITAFNFDSENYEKFAAEVHQAKVGAKAYRLFQIELVCDLLIGYAYYKLGKTKKAASIFNNVVETSEKSGLKTVSQLAWYFTAIQKSEGGNSQMALDIANSIVVNLEKDVNSSDFLFFLFKILLAKILLETGSIDTSKLCLSNAQLIKDKYGLLFDINLDYDINVPKVAEDNDYVDSVEDESKD